MKISTEYGSAVKIVGRERAIELIAKAGFDAWDFSLYEMLGYDAATGRRPIKYDHPFLSSDYLRVVRGLRQIGLDNGIVCNQAHAPFSSLDPEINLTYKRAIECAAEAGAENIVFHTMTAESLEANIGMFAAIVPFAKEYGIKVAVENTYFWPKGQEYPSPAPGSLPETLRAMLERVNDESFVACIDIGHAEMSALGTNAPELIRAAGERLACLHIQDCDHIHDSHELPFTMSVDFSEVVRALREVNYKGDLTLEASTHLYRYCKGAPEKIEEGLKQMYDSAKRLADMFVE